MAPQHASSEKSNLESTTSRRTSLPDRLKFILAWLAIYVAAFICAFVIAYFITFITPTSVDEAVSTVFVAAVFAFAPYSIAVIAFGVAREDLRRSGTHAQERKPTAFMRPLIVMLACYLVLSVLFSVFHISAVSHDAADASRESTSEPAASQETVNRATQASNNGVTASSTADSISPIYSESLTDISDSRRPTWTGSGDVSGYISVTYYSKDECTPEAIVQWANAYKDANDFWKDTPNMTYNYGVIAWTSDPAKMLEAGDTDAFENAMRTTGVYTNGKTVVYPVKLTINEEFHEDYSWNLTDDSVTYRIEDGSLVAI